VFLPPRQVLLWLVRLNSQLVLERPDGRVRGALMDLRGVHLVPPGTPP
jgi:hypothetical protein